MQDSKEEIKEADSMKIYGTTLCPDCRDAFERLAKEQISYELVDIMESTKNLREFLHLRDQRKEFDPVKAAGGIGIPCYVEDDGSIHF